MSGYIINRELMKKNLQSFTNEDFKKIQEEISEDTSLSGKRIATRKMLIMGMDIEIIQRITNFSVEEILKIQKNISF